MDGGVILITGDPGSGKTVSACTFPKPALMLDFDDGFKSALNAKDSSGNLIVGDHAEIHVENFVVENVYPLNFATEQKEKKAPEYTKESVRYMELWNAWAAELAKDGTITTSDGTKKGPFKTLIIDPISVMFLVWEDLIMNINKVSSIRKQDYKTLTGLLYKQFIPTLRKIQQKVPWIVLTNHIVMIENESDVTLEFPVGPSKAMGRSIARAFDEVWKQERVGDKFIWRTIPHGKFKVARSRTDLKDGIPAVFGSLR